MRKICVLLVLLSQLSVWARGVDVDFTKKNDFVAFSNGDTIWGTMIKNRGTGAGQPNGLTFLKTDGTVLKLTSTVLKKVEAYSIGLGRYVFQHISYFPEKNRPKKFYVTDKSYDGPWGINIYQFKSIAIVTNLKKQTMTFIEFVPASARDITPRKFYVFSLNGEYHRMNRANYKNIIIPHLQKNCAKMDKLCEANHNLCNPLSPHPINVFKKLFDEFVSTGCRCKF